MPKNLESYYLSTQQVQHSHICMIEWFTCLLFSILHGVHLANKYVVPNLEVR